MLVEAVNGEIPLVNVQSTDLMHIRFTLEGLFPNCALTRLGSDPDLDVGDAVFYHDCSQKVPGNLNDLFKLAEEEEYTIIFINHEPASQLMECGALLPDFKIIYTLLNNFELPEKIVAEATSYLQGLTIQEIKQVLSLVTVIYPRLSVETLRKTKERLFIHAVGLERVDRKTLFYFPEDQHDTWIEKVKKYMSQEVDHRLVPKGLLLHGVPGTGKTEFAKHLAREWELSLFLLDINSMLSKWQGEAEHHLSKALTMLDRESPCIVLFDEVEKLFVSESDDNTSQRLLSKLLWWLQSKTSKVFVVMTCNDMEALPTELYRAGRIDRPIELKGLKETNYGTFVLNLLQSFEADGHDKSCMKHINARLKSAKEMYGIDTETIPQATLSQWVIDYLQSQQFGL